jgi:hypothetical protein
MTESYEPASYWSTRLPQNFNLRGVVHIEYGRGYNDHLYRPKRNALDRALPGPSRTVRTGIVPDRRSMSSRPIARGVGRETGEAGVRSPSRADRSAAHMALTSARHPA